jgi:hypothetical protein
MAEFSVQVTPADGGWAVLCSVIDLPLMFRSGRRAEEQARRLAQCLVDLGHAARLEIQDRSGGVIGTRTYAPADALEAA